MTEPAETAFITGAASGIGAEIARQLVAEGARVVLADWNGDGVSALAGSLGPRASAVTLDVRDVAAVEAHIAAAWDALGGLSLVFANAGIGAAAPLLKATEDQFDVTFDVNVKGAWAVTRAAARLMVAAGRPGGLCLTGSEHSLGFQHAGNGLYTAAKHAVLGLADVLRHELPEDIRVSVLCPGLTATGIAESRAFSPLGPDAAHRLAIARALIAEGMPAGEVARAAIEGVRRGDFLIVTHAVSHAAARRRWEDIDAAFTAQAPMTAEAERYDVNAVLERLRRQRTSGGGLS